MSLSWYHGLVGSSLAVRSFGTLDARQVAALSRDALDLPLEGDAELWTGEIDGRALAIGAFERGHGMPPERPLTRRGTGGPPVVLEHGIFWVALSLAHPAALVACDAVRLMNRYVRPLLRALTSLGCDARYFGRDWVSVRHEPAAWIGMAHDAGSGRSFVESFVAVRTPFAPGPSPSLLDKTPSTLEQLSGRALDATQLQDAVVDAYAKAYGRDIVRAAADAPLSALDRDAELRSEPAWAATCDEAIGKLGAGPDARGEFRVGGELMASRDALARLSSLSAPLGPGASPEDVERIVRDAFEAPGVALFGVRSLASLRDVVVRALRASSA